MALKVRLAGRGLVGAAAAALSLFPGLAPGQPLERWRQITGAWTAEPGNGRNCLGQLKLSLAGGRLASLYDNGYVGDSRPFRVVAPNQISMESGQAYAIVDDGLVQVGQYGSCRFVRDPSASIVGSSDPANPHPSEPWTRMSAGWTLDPEAPTHGENCVPWMRIALSEGRISYANDRDDIFGSVQAGGWFFILSPNRMHLSQYVSQKIEGNTLTRSMSDGGQCVYSRDQGP